MGQRKLDYRGSLRDFPDFLRKHLIDNDIDGVLCFGDCRHYHKLAKTMADALGSAACRTTWCDVVRAKVTPQGARDIARHRLDIRPGMPVELFVRTGERTMMIYLLKPILDRMNSSLSEE